LAARVADRRAVAGSLAASRLFALARWSPANFRAIRSLVVCLRKSQLSFSGCSFPLNDSPGLPGSGQQCRATRRMQKGGSWERNCYGRAEASRPHRSAEGIRGAPRGWRWFKLARLLWSVKSPSLFVGVLEAELRGHNEVASDESGGAVAVSGATSVIGGTSQLKTAGGVYVFERWDSCPDGFHGTG
jgi:hypothetical protein